MGTSSPFHTAAEEDNDRREEHASTGRIRALEHDPSGRRRARDMVGRGGVGSEGRVGVGRSAGGGRTRAHELVSLPSTPASTTPSTAPPTLPSMGQLRRTYLTGHKIWACKKCKTHLTTQEMFLSDVRPWPTSHLLPIRSEPAAEHTVQPSLLTHCLSLLSHHIWPSILHHPRRVRSTLPTPTSLAPRARRPSPPPLPRPLFLFVFPYRRSSEVATVQRSSSKPS